MKKILYVFDDINYQSGAQKVTLYQIKCLSEKYDISVFSLTEPVQFPDLNVEIIGKQYWNEYAVYGKSMRQAIKSSDITYVQKLKRMIYAVAVRMGMGDSYINCILYDRLKPDFEAYDVVIVVSEASKLRKVVSALEHPRKIQWIHTDYASWSEFSDWTRKVTQSDKEIYGMYDRIVVLSDNSRQGLLKKIPELQDKTVVIPNLIDGDTILKKAKEEPDIVMDKDKINFITVGRLDKEKAFDYILDICKRLKEEGYIFCWYLVGQGPLKSHLEKRVLSEGLSDCVVLTGAKENPYSLMCQSDWFVLLSEYEGTPVTIDEAMVLGVPVMARDVGGIREQLGRMGNGVLIEKGQEYDVIVSEINKKQKQRFEYVIHNKIILSEIRTVLKVD